MYRTIKLRIYPNASQREIIDKTLRGCNFVWNKYIEFNNKRYENKEPFITAYMFSNILTILKKTDDQYYWLNGINNAALQHAVQHCHKAYKRYFRNETKHPRFKSKKKCNRFNSYFFTTRNRGFSLYEDNPLKPNIIKIPTLHNIRCPRKNTLPSQSIISSGRIIKEKSGKYYAMFRYNYNPSRDQKPYSPGIGIDLGIETYATIYYEDHRNPYQHPSYLDHDRYKEIDARIVNFQRIINKKAEINYGRLVHAYMDTHQGEEPSDSYKNHLLSKSFDSGNIRKIRKKIIRLFEKRTNYANNEIFQLVNKLVITKPKYITIENLEVNRMLSNEYENVLYGRHTLHDHIQKSKWFMFKVQLMNKCSEHDIPLRVANVRYPSSKICSNCGRYHKYFSLDMRTFVCQECGLKMHRDINAAKNLCFLETYEFLKPASAI